MLEITSLTFQQVRPKSELDKRPWDVENQFGAKPEGADGCTELDPLATNGDSEGQSSSKRGSVSSISTGSYDENDVPVVTGPKWSGGYHMSLNKTIL